MDKKALKILSDSFWSSTGWKSEHERHSSPEDFAYAKSKGVMFDPVRLDHAGAVNKLFNTIKRMERRQVTDAFLASLSTRRLDWRSPLGSYAVFQNCVLHPHSGHAGRCNVCGLYAGEEEVNLNILNFERWMWGGVRHDQVVYAAFDLSLLLAGEVPKPAAEDLEIFRRLIAAIVAVPPGVTSAGLHTHFAKVLKSNKAERNVLVGILGFCGILGTSDHPGYTESFVAFNNRKIPDRRFVDMSFPACWWRASDGVSQTMLAHYFGYAL